MMKKTLALAIMSIAALSSVSAIAQQVSSDVQPVVESVAQEPAQEYSKWYGGVGVGQSTVSLSSTDFHVNPSIIAAGYTAAEYSTTSDVSYNIYAGYRYCKYFSAKIEYTNFGKEVYGSNISGPGGTGNANSNLSLQTLSVGAVATYPVYQKLSVLGELGGFYYTGTRDPSHSGVTTTLTGTPSSSTGSGVKPYAALGLQYDVNEKVAVVGKYTYYGTIGSSDNIGGITLSNVNVSLQYNF